MAQDGLDNYVQVDVWILIFGEAEQGRASRWR